MVVHSKKSRFQQKFENKLFHFNRNSQLSSVCKKRSRWTTGVGVGQKNPTPAPSVVRNPTPPKNLRLLTTPQPCWRDKYIASVRNKQLTIREGYSSGYLQKSKYAAQWHNCHPAHQQKRSGKTGLSESISVRPNCKN